MAFSCSTVRGSDLSCTKDSRALNMTVWAPFGIPATRSRKTGSISANPSTSSTSVGILSVILCAPTPHPVAGGSEMQTHCLPGGQPVLKEEDARPQMARGVVLHRSPAPKLLWRCHQRLLVLVLVLVLVAYCSVVGPPGGFQLHQSADRTGVRGNNDRDRRLTRHQTIYKLHFVYDSHYVSRCRYFCR